MHAQQAQPTSPENGAEPATSTQQVSRRTMLKLGALDLASSTLGILEAGAWPPQRAAYTASISLPDIHFYAQSEPFTERCQYLFRSNPIPSSGYTKGIHYHLCGSSSTRLYSG